MVGRSLWFPTLCAPCGRASPVSLAPTIPEQPVSAAAQGTPHFAGTWHFQHFLLLPLPASPSLISIKWKKKRKKMLTAPSKFSPRPPLLQDSLSFHANPTHSSSTASALHPSLPRLFTDLFSAPTSPWTPQDRSFCGFSALRVCGRVPPTPQRSV